MYQKEGANVSEETFTQDYILSNLLFSIEGIYREKILMLLTKNPLNPSNAPKNNHL